MMLQAVPVGLVINTMGFGGVPEVVLQLARRLPLHGFVPHLCVLKRDTRSSEPGQEARRAQFEAAGTTIHYASAGSGKIDAVAGVARWAGELGLALVHTHSYRPNVYGRLGGMLRRPCGLRLIAHYHNQYDDKWAAEPAMLALERELAQSTDAMVAVSESVRTHVAAHVHVDTQRIEVVPNGHDGAVGVTVDRAAARATLDVAPSALAVGLIGRVCEQKGQEDFVEAARAIAARHPEAVFLMAGHVEDRPLYDKLRHRISQEGLEHRVRFLGHRTDMMSVYAALDIVAAPSRWEGFGLMLVEAMTAGRPLVATRVGAIPEVVREDETALLIPARDPSALAAALSLLLSNPSLRLALGAAGTRHSARYSWDATASGVAAIYDRILGRPV